MMKSLLLAAAVALMLSQVSGCAGGAALRPVPPLGAEVDTCEDAKNYPASAANPEPTGELRGWVVLAYALNEEGQPQQVRVIDSEPKGLLVNGALQSLARTPFKRGIQKPLCVDVVTVYRH